MIRLRLDNGLLVLVDELPGCARVAISLHYGVGFRTEPPGREGFAHLFEHLMFRGSGNLRPGTFYDQVYAAAGQAGGTTHQDYTEYFQIVPSDAVGQALFRDADRMRAPVFTSGIIAEQLAGVREEIRAATVDRPYGGCPWPLLPAVLFHTHANTHDGYGDVERLARVTPADCYAFFDAHYAPSNAVLTIVGGVDGNHALALAEEHFGDIRDRLVTPADITDPPLQRDRWVLCTEPGVSRTAVALGLVLPDPARHLRRYLAHLLLAAVARRQLSGSSTWPAVDVGCGFFGPLDARAPDAMVTVALLGQDVSPEQFVDRVIGMFLALATRGDLEGAVGLAVEGLVAEHERQHVEPQIRARALGRWEILFDRAELLHELPTLLRAITLDDVRAAASDVAQAPKAVVVIEPSAQRTRPAPPLPAALGGDGPRSTGTGAHDTPGMRGRHTGHEGTTRRVWGVGVMRRAPSLEGRCVPRFTGLMSEAFGAGGRLVVLPDRRARLAQMRVRWPLGHHGVAGFRRTQELATLLLRVSRCCEHAAALGGALALDTDGQWLDLTGDAPVPAIRAWLDVFAELLEVTVPAADEAQCRAPGSSRQPDPFVVGDAAWRRQRLAAQPPVPPVWTFAQLVSPGAVAVVVADEDPAVIGAMVRAALGPAGFEVAGAVARDTVGGDHLTLHCAHPDVPADDPGWYVATGLLGGYHNARLASRLSRHGGGCQAFCGRDRFLGVSRSYVRVVVGPDLLSAAIADVLEEIGGLSTYPPGPAEIATARRYCSAQALSLFDTPATEADVLCRSISTGFELHAVETLPIRLAEVADADVVAATAGLFGTGPYSAIVVGRSRFEDVAHALRRGSADPVADAPDRGDQPGAIQFRAQPSQMHVQ